MSIRSFLVRFAAGATAMALLALLVGFALVAPADRSGVLAGAGIALTVQIAAFWLLGFVFFPGRRLLVFGLGMATRLAVLLGVALLAGPLGLPLGPTLLTLVGVFLLTSLLEPLVFQSEIESAR